MKKVQEPSSDQGVEFSNAGDEDPFFFGHDRLLPYVSEVQAFNSQWRNASTLKLGGVQELEFWYPMI